MRPCRVFVSLWSQGAFTNLPVCMSFSFYHRLIILPLYCYSSQDSMTLLKWNLFLSPISASSPLPPFLVSMEQSGRPRGREERGDWSGKSGRGTTPWNTFSLSLFLYAVSQPRSFLVNYISVLSVWLPDGERRGRESRRWDVGGNV